MTKLFESDVEKLAIERLEKLGYHYIHGPDIERGAGDVVLVERLRAAVARINPKIPDDACDDAIRQILRIHSPELIANNETFHRMLTEGVNVHYQKAGDGRGDYVKLVDFDNLANNDFLVVNQFTVIENQNHKRPDVVLFVNGLPLVVVELKNPADENATIKTAFEQLRGYKRTIPSLFTYNGLLIVSDGLEARAGSISANLGRFMTWKTTDGRTEASHLVGQMETLIEGMLRPETLLDLIRHFTVFEKSKKEDKNGIITIETIKKIGYYHQYYAVNRAVESTLRAAGFRYSKEKLTDGVKGHKLSGVATQPAGDRKGGVVWHTQGSGKSLSMVFYTGKVVLKMDNPTVVVITDRNDLDDQLFDTFAASRQLLRQEPVQAKNCEHLKELLKVNSGGVVFTTIQKFQPEEGNVYETLSSRENIIVIADEAHRTQYGFHARTIDEKDANGQVVGKRTVYGLAKYLRDALPNATYLGFTGTPIEKTDANTPAVFGSYIDIYDIDQAVLDGATLKIFYESRLAKIKLSEEGRKLIEQLDLDLEEDDLDATQKAKAKWTQLEALVGSDARIRRVAADIVDHFEKRQEILEGKAMIVAMSRRIAAELYKEIVALRPGWHNDDLKKGKIKVVMTSDAKRDSDEIAKHQTTKEQRRMLADRMKNPDDELRLVIVCDMWLTGFDVPPLNALYIDKPMKGHNLMQAIARVNRIYKDKPGGLIVDYLGIAADLKEALSFYTDSGGQGDPAIPQDQAVGLMLEKLEVLSQMFHGFDYEEYFDADTSRKLSIILGAEEHVLGLDEGKSRFLREVTALSQAFAIAMPHEQALDARDEIAFFQAVKSRLAKFDGTRTGRTDEELETAIRQVVDRALVSEQVVDIYAAAGIRKPEISILSDEFLAEVRDMEHKNIAIELLRRLLNDEIKTRSRTNFVQSRTLMEMLENAIKKYHNKIVTAAEVIEELIHLGKKIQNEDKEPAEMGLSEYEYGFYTAIAHNESAREVMQKDKLRELAVVLYNKVKANASIDWTIKESVRARLKVIVKRTLRQYGYPPDMQKLATETVLQQAERIAEELTKEKGTASAV